MRPWPFNGNWSATPRAARVYASIVGLVAVGVLALDRSVSSGPVRLTVSPWAATIVLGAATCVAVLYTQASHMRVRAIDGPIVWDVGGVFEVTAALLLAPSVAAVVVTCWALAAWVRGRQAIYKLMFNWSTQLLATSAVFAVARLILDRQLTAQVQPGRFVAAVMCGAVAWTVLDAALPMFLMRLLTGDLPQGVLRMAVANVRQSAVAGGLAALWGISQWWALLCLPVAISLTKDVIGHGHRMASLTDSKTSLANAKGFQQALCRELARSQRRGGAFSVAIVDLDGFRRVNSLHGHLGGDAVLRQLGDRLRAATRAQDVAARWGGDELVWLMPDTALEEASAAAERFRRLVAYKPFTFEGATFEVTVSIGVSAWRPGWDDHELLRTADARLYKAKGAGRNRVNPPPGPSEVPTTPAGTADPALTRH